MKKVFIQLLIIATLFCGTWFVFSKIGWIRILHLEQAGKSTEEKLGNLLWENLRQSEKELMQDSICMPVRKIFKRICDKNNIEGDSIHINIIQKDEINAFALPGNRIIVFSGLIESCENEAELSGVLGHELAHIRKNHIMKKLVKEFGLSVLISMTAGKSGSDVLQKALRELASSAYSRELETEADKTSADYLIAAQINPAPFADFLYRLSMADSSSEKFMHLISTHPGSKERSEAIVHYLQNKKFKQEPVLEPAQWAALKLQIADITATGKKTPW